MSNISNSLLQMNNIENMNQKNTVIHRMEPAVKLLITLMYLIVVISVNPYQVSRLIPYLFYPVIGIILAEISLRTMIKYLVIAMPFTLFTGISNLFLNREIAFPMANVVITQGMLSCCFVLLKSILTILAVVILTSTTSMDDLLYAMIHFKVPIIIVTQIMFTYRYIGVIAEEASIMYHGYILRAPKAKAIKAKDMGPFLGQLIIRSFDRAERIYQAMKCRGFEGYVSFSGKKGISGKGWFYVVITAGILIALRLVNISILLGKLFM
ncbi:MAG: cbiQ2 [Anaerocolumna sp.]|nr:cbiQ2 [Anaerocolumna sp.]